MNKNTSQEKWSKVQLKYKMIKFAGQGSFGVVLKARNRETKETVAIKHIGDAYSDPYTFKKVVREIQILTQLTKMKGNIFTSKLIEIITDGDDIFLVMEYKCSDLKRLMSEPMLDDFKFS